MGALRIGAKSRTNIYRTPKALFWALEMLQWTEGT